MEIKSFRNFWHSLTPDEQRQARRDMIAEARKTMSYLKARSAVNSAIRNASSGKLDAAHALNLTEAK